MDEINLALESALASCIRGNVVDCLQLLHRALPLDAVAQDYDLHLNLLLDSLTAILPQRLMAACGVASESHCLSLLDRLSGNGLIRADGILHDGYAGLSIALLHGLGTPLRATELNANLIEFARDSVRATDDPDLYPIFNDTFVGDSLAALATTLAPTARDRFPGNATARLLSTTARARWGTYGETDRGIWLEKGLVEYANWVAPTTSSDAATDWRAVIHLSFYALDTSYLVAELDRDAVQALAALQKILELARIAGTNGFAEESFFLHGRVAFRSGQFTPDSPIEPVSRIVEALGSVEACELPNVAFLSDLVHVAAPTSTDKRLMGPAQHCWDAIRQSYSALAQEMPAASRWRSATRIVRQLEGIPLLSLAFDRNRWYTPEFWSRALLPMFYSHPYDWRDISPTAEKKFDLRAIATCGGTGAWAVNSPNPLLQVVFAENLASELWRLPSPMGIWMVGLDNIRDEMTRSVNDLGEAGLYPIVRTFNRATRNRFDPAFADFAVEELVDVASARLDNIHKLIGSHDDLAVAEGELVASIGALYQVPWEISANREAITAHICLDPRSTGTSVVSVPMASLEGSRVAIVGDSDDLSQSGDEVVGIVRAYGSRVQFVNQVSLSAIEAAAATCPVLHLAAHGVQAWQDPRESALVFAHGTLAAEDLARLDLTNVDLVVVNACDAAAPGEAGTVGDGSIAGALIAAGAKAVIAALWSAHESCCARFATDLYSGLATGMSLIESFCEARTLLRAYAETLVSGRSSFLADPYRLLLRGRGSADGGA